MSFPYGPPGEDTYAQCDPLIVDLVRRINADTDLNLKTVQSCEGHPWPFLELCGELEDLSVAAGRMMLMIPEKIQLVVVVVVRELVNEPRLKMMVNSERWRFTVIPTRCDPGAVAEARAVLAAPWP